MVVKIIPQKPNFYTTLINELEKSTNLSEISKKLKISKQSLNYYLRKLKESGNLIKKGKGWYEVKKPVKIIPQDGSTLGISKSKDKIRGHAYIWTIKITKEIPNWNNRISLLEAKNNHYILVGAFKTTPRIKVLGRNVWLGNKKIIIYDKKKQSYYGSNAVESRKLAFQELLLIVGALERKLGVSLRPFEFEWNKEHYALIKNDLAIQENRQGNQWHITDEDGEWLIIDDSLGEGGELETIGKKAFQTNVPLQKWWNDQKKHKFEVGATFIVNSLKETNDAIGVLIQDRRYWAENQRTHVEAIQTLSNAVKQLQEEVSKLNHDK